ncbi:MAG: hypothetical protein V1889_03185 [archaeon]
MERKKILMVGMVLILAVSFVSFASAEFWACFEKGDVVKYCSGYKPDWTCGLSSGCEKCISIYRESENCYVHGIWSECNKVSKNCSNLGTNQTVDGEPPEFDLNSPVEGGLYSSRSVLVDFDLNEIADVYYYDNINGRGKWVRVCQECSAGAHSYSKTRSFSEGLNDLTFKAVDVVGNSVEVGRTFIVDSKKPKISGVEPRSGATNGLLSLDFIEENPEEIVLEFGVAGDMEIMNFDSNWIAGNCGVNVKDARKRHCEFDVRAEMARFDGEISYSFSVEDVVGNVYEKGVKKIVADTSAPVLNNPLDFWRVDGKYVYFNLNISEENLDEVTYSYIDSRGREKVGKICSRLKNGICEAKKSFRSGEEIVGIQIVDEAGNGVGYGINFLMQY